MRDGGSWPHRRSGSRPSVGGAMGCAEEEAS